MIIKYRFNFFVKKTLDELRHLDHRYLDDKEMFMLEVENLCEIVKNQFGYDFFIQNVSPGFDELKSIVSKYKGITPQDCEYIIPDEVTRETEYFVVYPTWRNGYPHYQSDYIKRSFRLDPPAKCECNAIQIAPININRYPKWTNRHFMGLFWLHDLLFCDPVIKELCQKNEIKGVEFGDVYFRNKETPLEDVFQLTITHTTQTPFKYHQQEITSAFICKSCGKLKVYRSEDYLYKIDSPSFDVNCDVFYSGKMFNSRKIIISKKLYRLLMEHKYLKGLNVQPLFTHKNRYLIDGVKQLDTYRLWEKFYDGYTFQKVETDSFINIFPGRENEVPESKLIEYKSLILED